MKKPNYFIVVLLIVAGLTVGFFQEFVKININYTLDTGFQIPNFFEQDYTTRTELLRKMKPANMPYDYYQNHNQIEALNHLSYKQLTILKWTVAILFAAVFMAINIGVIWFITKNKSYTKWVLIFYAALFILSFAIFLFGKITGTSERAYAVSREILGGLQSIVPLMVLVPAIWLSKKTTTVIED